MPRLVVSTATLSCNAGSSTSPLVCTGLAQVEAIFSTAGGVTDHVPGQNVFPFGHCKKTGKACVPLTPNDWSPAASITFSGTSALREDAKLVCEERGEISVDDPGPHRVDRGALQSSFEQHLTERIRETEPALLTQFLQQLTLVGLTALPESALDAAYDAALESERKLESRGRPVAKLKTAMKGIKALKMIMKTSIGSVLDIAAIIDALKEGKVKKAEQNAVGFGAGLAATEGCAATFSTAVASGPGGAAAVGVGCGVTGIAVGLGVGELAKHLPIIGD